MSQTFNNVIPQGLVDQIVILSEKHGHSFELMAGVLEIIGVLRVDFRARGTFLASDPAPKVPKEVFRAIAAVVFHVCDGRRR